MFVLAKKFFFFVEILQFKMDTDPFDSLNEKINMQARMYVRMNLTLLLQSKMRFIHKIRREKNTAIKCHEIQSPVGSKYNSN